MREDQLKNDPKALGRAAGLDEQQQKQLENAYARAYGQDPPYDVEPTRIQPGSNIPSDPGYDISWDLVNTPEAYKQVRSSLLELARAGNTRAYTDLIRLNWLQVDSHKTVPLADNPALQAGVERGMAMVQNRYRDNSAVVTQQILNTPRTVFDFDPLGTRLSAFKDTALDWFAANGAAADQNGNGFLYGLNGAGYALTEALMPRSTAEIVLGAAGGVVAGRAIGAGAAYLAREFPILGENVGTLAGRGLDWAVDRLSPGMPYGSPAAQAGRLNLGAFGPAGPLNPSDAIGILREMYLVGGDGTAAARVIADASRHQAHNVDRVILGKWEGQDSGYIGYAREHGGIWFDTGKLDAKMVGDLPSEWQEALRWQVNEQFLQSQMERGVSEFHFFGENPDLIKAFRSDSFSAREVRFLEDNAARFGYIREGNSWVKAGGAP